MAATKISIDEFILLAQQYLVVDVRSPQEFAHAHFPSAISVSLFNDEERKIVGTTYKQQSREQAIKIGLDFFGGKMKNIVTTVEGELHKRNSKTVIVHCWRGGMRSAAIAWLLDLYGFKVYILEGGYKKFRNWVLHQLAKKYTLKILGGYTGSGKTAILQQLKQLNELVIDLEDLAMHKGSAFGSLGLPAQCTTEMFENKLALQLFFLSKQQKVIWVESESQRIGNINIQATFYQQMLNAPYVFLNISFEERLQLVVEEYGKFKKHDLADAIERIQKRLGGLETKMALSFLMNDDIKSCFEILLKYYDKFYSKSSQAFFANKIIINLPNTNAHLNAIALLNTIN